MRAFVITAIAVLCFPLSAWAFCGFYVSGGDASLFANATQVALVRHGNETILAMQNSYDGPPEAFAMVVPVPQVLQKGSVKTLPKSAFDRLDKLTAPRLVEYWEKDPCPPPRRKYDYGTETTSFNESAGAPPPAVRVEAKFEVGEYDVVVLSADDSTSLDRYLKEQKYNIPKGAEPYLRPYVESGMYFFVAKVNPDRVKFEAGRAVLSPLRFRYTSDSLALPVRLGMINSSGTQDLIVYVLAQQRYEVANYPNAFIPTNIEVDEDVADRFGDFYRAIFDATLRKNPKAVVTEYSWIGSSCDPCPTPPLGPQDFAYLGANEFEDVSARSWVVTRLHARYAPDDIGEDLVFRKAGAVAGGREFLVGDIVEQGFVESSVNQFQGRYIIRHPWSGPILCTDPTLGRWGGASDWSAGRAISALSPNSLDGLLAFGEIDLEGLLRQGVPELDIAGGAPAPAGPTMGRAVRGYLLTVLWGLLLFTPLLLWLQYKKRRARRSEQ